MYAIDFGGQSAMKALEGLPHVGAICTRFEPERVERLISYIHREVGRRNDLFRRARVDNRSEYNARRSPDQLLPAIYFLLDGFGDFKSTFPSEVVKGISSLVSGGAASGLYLIISAGIQGDLPTEMFASVSTRLTFHQADQSEYMRLVGRPSAALLEEDASHPPPPGRGLLRGTPPLEFHAALPTAGRTDEEQASALGGLADRMDQAWHGSRPPEIQSLPLLVTLHPPRARSGASENESASLSVEIGQDYDSLGPVNISLVHDGPTFLIAGAFPQCGKTTLLQMWTLALVERYGPHQVQFAIFDFQGRSLGPFRQLPHVLAYGGSQSSLGSITSLLSDTIQRRGQSIESAYQNDPAGFERDALVSSWPNLVVLIDDYDSFSAKSTQERSRMAEILADAGELGVSVILAGNTAELPRDYDDTLIQRARKHGCGVLLGAADGMDQFNNARKPQGQWPSPLPTGRGFIIRRGQARLFQAAVFCEEGEDSMDALIARVARVREENRSVGGAGSTE